MPGIQAITVTFAASNAVVVQNTMQLPVQLQKDVRYHIFVYLDSLLPPATEVENLYIGGKRLEGTSYMRGMNMVSATYRGRTIKTSGLHSLEIRLNRGDPIILNNAFEML